VVLPPRSPNLNAYCERFVRSIKEETLDQIVLGSRPAAAPQRSLAALSCTPVSPYGSPAARSRGLRPVTPRQACPVAPASSQLAAGRAPCQPPGEGLGRRPVASTTQRVHSQRDCGKIAFEIPILFGRCETVRHL
jgi:hypothetical protein